MEIAGTKPEPVSVLLVDDNPARLLSYRTILEPLGEKLVEANSGRDALRRVMDEEFAVILLDVSMPDMDGFETASLIHQHPRFERTPIIFVSAVNVSDLDRLRGYKLGAVDYVMVPIIPEILRGKVMVLAELFRKRSELQAANFSLAIANTELAAANAALQVEKAREVHKLNESLRTANVELALSNQSLHLEILERRNAEERLRQTDRRKDEFLATLAHELRNPLAPIQSALNVHRLARTRGTGEDEALQGVMERQMRHLVRLVDDLLDISRITRDRLELRLDRVDLRDLITAAVEIVQPMILASQQQVRVKIPPEPLSLLADSDRLAQVFSNLLNNASKFSNVGATIEVCATIVADWVSVTVHDNGIGLDQDHLPGIFDLFAQVDTSLRRSRGGLGIGLTLARRLVEMHGGQITATSQGLGRGSEFTVKLPLQVADADAGIDDVSPRSDAVEPVEQTLRVMVVDDNKDSADMLALSLKMMGHEVLALNDPSAVTEAARDYVPDLVFMDIGMPLLDGFALATQLRAQPWPGDRCPRLVALTGWGQEEDRRRSEQAGFDEHLVKPADLETIERVCRSTAQSSQAKKAAAA
jgi:signal transduction histidine kinase